MNALSFGSFGIQSLHLDAFQLPSVKNARRATCSQTQTKWANLIQRFSPQTGKNPQMFFWEKYRVPDFWT